MGEAKPQILVLGATGQVGRAVIRHLLADNSVEVIAAARNPQKASGLGVRVLHLDLDKFESIMPALKNINRVFLATAYTVDMLRQSKDLVNAARKSGVEQIVHLGACGDDDTRVDHYAWHQFIERYISSAGFSFYTHLRPELFMQNLLGYGGESSIKQGVIRLYIGDARLSWVDCDDVAALAATSLLDPQKHHAKTYRMGYEAKNYTEIAELMTLLLNQPFRYEPHAPEEFLQKVVSAGGEPAYMKSVYECYRDYTNGTLRGDEVFDNFPALMGRQPRSLTDFVSANAAVFRY
jgi:NAD(P)H dehydrogenase (quinone)